MCVIIKKDFACEIPAQADLIIAKRRKTMLKRREKFAYGLGAVGKDMVYMLSASYVLYYYEDILGVSAIAMGMILMFARVFDAFNDPVMGVLVAKTKTRFGKFRPWLFIGTLLNAVTLFFLFAAPPSLDGKGLVAYSAIFYILWGVTYTMMDIPYWSMIPAFTKGGKEREGLSTLARSCAGVGSALITVVTMILVPMLGKIGHADLANLVKAGEASDATNEAVTIGKQAAAQIERYGFRLFGLAVAVLFVVFIVITCLAIREKSTVDVKSPTVGEMFRALLQNDQAMTIVFTIVLVNCAVYTTSNLVIYFFKYDFGGANWNDNYVLFNTFGGAVQILSMMLLFPLLRKFFSTLQVFYISLFAAISGYVVLLLLTFTNMKQVYLLFLPGFFIFAANGILTVLTTVFLANTVDYGELKNYRRDESVIFSMQTFVVKLASGVAALIASLCLGIFHISNDTAAAANSTAGTSLVGLRMTMTVVPILGLIAAVILFHKKFILSAKKMDEITTELKKRGENR